MICHHKHRYTIALVIRSWKHIKCTILPLQFPQKKELSPNFKPQKEKKCSCLMPVFVFTCYFSCSRIVIPANSVCYLESAVSAEGIWSLFPGVVPRSGQARCCSVIIPLLLLQDTSLTFSNLHTLHLHMALPDVVIAAALACSPPFPVCF